MTDVKRIPPIYSQLSSAAPVKQATEWMGRHVQLIASIGTIALMLSAIIRWIYMQSIQDTPKTAHSLIDKVKQLGEDCDGILNTIGFPQLRGAQRQALLARFVELRQELASSKGQPELATWYKYFEEIETQFGRLIQARLALINAPIRMDDNGRIPAADKGNCFFEAAATALEIYGARSAAASTMDSTFTYRVMPEDLRAETVRWGQGHIESDVVFRGYVDAGIQVFIDDVQKEITEKRHTIALFTLSSSFTGTDTTTIQREIEALEKKIAPFSNPADRISYYFYLAAQDRFWAGLAEAYAFAEQYNVRVLVREENKGVVKPIPQCLRFNEHGHTQIQVWWIDGHHFENKAEKL